MRTKFAMVFCGVVLLVCAALAAAQDCLEPVGRWPYGVSNSVAAEGNIAVLGSGAALQVLNISVPSAPSVIGEVFLPTEVRAVALAGSIAYAIDHDALFVVDVGGPTPVELGVLAGFGGGFEIAVDGEFVYLLSYRRLSIVEVSDPSAPTLRGEFVWSEGSPSDVRVASNHAFVSDSDGGFRVVAVGEPPSPVEIAVLDLGADSSARHLDVANGLAYVVGERPSFVDRLFVVDLTDPAQPTIVASPTVGGSQDITVNQGLAVITDSQHLFTYDVTNPTSPTLSGQVTVSPILLSEYRRLAAVDDFALIAGSEDGLTIVDISDPSDPVVAAAVAAPGEISDAAFADDVLFIAAGSRGFRAVDVADPTRPSELVQTVLPGVPVVSGVDVQGDIAWLAALGAGLIALDVTDPAVPVVVGNAPGAIGTCLAVSGDRAYVVRSQPGSIAVVDISSPGSPVVMGTLDLDSGYWVWPVVMGDHLIVRNHYVPSSVVVVDASVPTAPVEVAAFDLELCCGGLAASGSWLLVPDIDVGITPVIRVFDMSDPNAPAEVEPYLPVGGEALALGVAGSVAYLRVYGKPPYPTGAIEAVNFADPTAPVFMDLIEHAGGVLSNWFTFSPGEVYFVDRFVGFDAFALCRGPIFVDGFESGDTTAWSSAAP